MIETLIVDGWLQSVLGSDATLLAAAPSGVHADVAPDGTDGIWVVYFMVSAVDLIVTGTKRVWTDAVYEVRATGRAVGYAALKPAANRIDALLHGKSGSTADGTVVESVRTEPVRFTETDGGVVYRHLGGQYRIKGQE